MYNQTICCTSTFTRSILRVPIEFQEVALTREKCCMGFKMTAMLFDTKVCCEDI
jgi:hypothetical protein